MRKEYITILVLLLMYLVFSVTTLLVWHHKGRYSVTGDEPHYLVLANGITRHGVLEQTAPYNEEFKNKEIYKPGLVFFNKSRHLIKGPNGLFSVHNIGLPLILALPYFLGGVLGAKLFMIMLSSLAVFFVWKISGILTTIHLNKFLSTLAICVALPLIPASNQIYPDMLGGVIALSGIYWFMTTGMHRSAVTEGFWAVALVFLPWLHIKFTATSVILVFALTLKIYLESKDIRRIAAIIVSAVFSCSLLVLYNYYAFGKISGPYQSGALELSKATLMVFLGLFFDQNQGFLLQNPILFVGLFSVGLLFAYDKRLILVWLLLIISVILPNALHTNLYGGYSFSGRFAWAACIIFALPTIYGLITLAKVNYKVFRLVVGVSVVLQLHFLSQYLFGAADLYAKPLFTWLDHYSNYYYPIQSWMPALYNVHWAYNYGPNLGWLIVALFILALGFLNSLKIMKVSTKAIVFNLLCFLTIIFASGFVGKNSDRPIFYFGKDLPSQSGRTLGTIRIATQGRDAPGFVTFGPYYHLRKGSYRVMIIYSSIASIEQSVGTWDIYDANDMDQIASYPLCGTGGVVKTLGTSFEIHNWKAHSFEFRNYWNGISEIQVHGIVLKRF